MDAHGGTCVLARQEWFSTLDFDPGLYEPFTEATLPLWRHLHATACTLRRRFEELEEDQDSTAG